MTCFSCRYLLFAFYQPDIAVLNRMTMILQVYRSGSLALSLPPVPGIRNLNIVLYFDTVLIDGYTWILFDTTVGIESRSPEFDVVSLPCLRRQARVNSGSCNIVQTRAVTGSMHQAE